jgi:glycosyltransferase involved in cell wall biosynthesis
MRILHVADRLSDRGGADLALLGLLDALSDGHELHLAVGRDDGVVRPPCAVSVVPGLDARTRAGAELDPLIVRQRPDVVHVHNVVNPAVLEWAAGVDAVVTVQDHRFFCPGRGKWTSDGRVCADAMGRETCAGCFEDVRYFEDTLALTTERLDALKRLRVTVLSAYMQQELVRAGIRAERVAVVPPVAYGLVPEARAEAPPCALFVGRVVEAKGIRDAIEAWRRSRSDLPFVVAGTGPLRREIEAEGVEVLGWLDRGRLSATYRRAAVVVMPSRWQEPFGLVGLEALTLGTPVAAWDSGGVREWHPGGELLAPWGDIDGLAAALRIAPGKEVNPPRGFGRDALASRLAAVYAAR